MPSSKAGKSSVKNPSRDVSCEKGVQMHITGAHIDTGYPDHKSQRRFVGNGKPPENPFGHEMEAPSVGPGGPK